MPLNISELKIDSAVEELLQQSIEKNRELYQLLASQEKAEYPDDHKAGMIVPKGGSNCAKCEYVRNDGKECANKYFQQWHGSNELPAPADEYCCDWFEAKPDLQAYGTSEGVRKEWEERIRNAHGISVDIFDRYKRTNPNAISVKTFLDHDPPSHETREEIAKAFVDAQKVDQEDVDISSLTPLQDTVFKDKVEQIRTEGMYRNPITVFRYHDHQYVIDGHHRLAVLALEDHTTTPANIYEPKKEKDLAAEALWHGIPIEGFNTNGEEMVRACISRVPPELLDNVKCIKAAPELQPKHGQYLPETKTILLNPLIFNLRQRFGQGEGWVTHPELTAVHEVGHSLYYWFPEKLKDQWRDLSGWMVGSQEGQAPPYTEKRPGWPHNTSSWTHKEGIKFTRKYAQRNDDEDFADCFAFGLLGKPHQMEPSKRDFIDKIIKERVKNYPQTGIFGPEKPYPERQINAYGTSEGLEKAWDTRGRGRKPVVHYAKYDQPSKEPGYVGPVEEFYHGTVSDNLASILKKGLTQDEKQKFKLWDMDRDGPLTTRTHGFVYLTRDKHLAEWYAEFKQKYMTTAKGNYVQARYMDDSPDDPPALTFRKDADTPIMPGSKPAIVTLEIPMKDEAMLQHDPSSPGQDAWMVKGKIPPKYLGEIDVYDGGKWKPWWTKAQGRIGAEQTVPIYLVFYGPTQHIALALDTSAS